MSIYYAQSLEIKFTLNIFSNWYLETLADKISAEATFMQR